VILVTNVPARVLISACNGPFAFPLLHLVLATFFVLAINRFLWQFVFSHYTSARS